MRENSLKASAAARQRVKSMLLVFRDERYQFSERLISYEIYMGVSGLFCSLRASSEEVRHLPLVYGAHSLRP